MRFNSSLSTFVCAAAVVVGPTLESWAEEPYEVAWSQDIHTEYWDESYSVAVDGDGNVLVSGFTLGDITGGLSRLDRDPFVIKYDALGNQIWARQIGTSAADASYAVTVDSQGDAYIAGVTRGDLGGSNAGAGDAFLIKIDSMGNEVWSQQIGRSGSDVANSVDVDPAGNVYLSGHTTGNIGGVPAGNADAFLVKYDASGRYLWARQIGTEAVDGSHSIALDSAGNAYMAGSTRGDLIEPSAGELDAFLIKYDAIGSIVWSRQLGSEYSDSSSSVAVDSLGNVLIAGYTEGDLVSANNGGKDIILVKYDPSGEVLWARQVGTRSDDQAESIAVDAAGNAYISGYTSGSFGGPNAGDADAFLARFDASGNLRWIRQIGTTRDDFSRSIAVGPAGNVFISGAHGNFSDVLAMEIDGFLIKFAVPEPTTIPLIALGGLILISRRRAPCPHRAAGRACAEGRSRPL